MFTYFMSLKPGHFKTYSTPTESFWCCVGSGMENHTKYGEAIYFHGDDELFVNLFIPSALNWRERGFSLEQKTDYPRSNTTQIRITAAKREPLTLRVRAPAWATSPLILKLNGKALDVAATPGMYASIARVWQIGDRLEVTVPMAVRAEPLQGSANLAAFVYGPVVLAGDLGPIERSATVPYAADQAANLKSADPSVPVLAADAANAVASMRRVPGDGLAFRTERIGRPDDVTLRPFSDLHYRRYTVYWTLASPDTHN
jgi:DUF1680 family protein